MGEINRRAGSRQSRHFDPGVEGPGQIARIAIGDVLRKTARTLPGHVAYHDGPRRITFDELDRAVNRLANHLVGLGLEPGQRVAMMCRNSIELVIGIFACHRAGVIWVPVNVMLGPEDVRYTLEHAGVSHLLCDPDLADDAGMGGIASAMGIARTILEPGIPVADGQPETEPDVDIDRDDVAMIIYTSGTTSRPKGAMHTHQSIVMGAMATALEWRLDRNDGVTLQLPLFHIGGHSLLMSHILVGAKAALMQGFDPEEMLRVIHEHRLTMCVGLPMMYAQMIDHPARARYSTESLRQNIYTMAPMPEPLMRRLIAEFSPNFMLTSGQTEMYPVTTIARPERQLQRFGNYWGEASLINDLAIMDGNGALLGRNQPGELVHRGANVMYGYYKNPEATAAARAHGWHHTGDMALVDDHGEMLFLDRFKDMIKSGGENVPSVKIEECLLAAPGVESAAVVGLPHPRWGEAVTGFVTLKKDGRAVDEEAILDHCRAYLGGFQVPKRIVVLDRLPTTATGKMRKLDLRLEYAGLYENA